MQNSSKKIIALLGPTNTGKTHDAIEKMLEFDSGIFGLPLRLLAREVYEKCVKKIGVNKVVCINEGKDQYKRNLAECFVNDKSLSSYLVRSGYAFTYRKYSKKFIKDQDYARINRLGMWSMKFEYPWDFRRNN